MSIDTHILELWFATTGIALLFVLLLIVFLLWLVGFVSHRVEQLLAVRNLGLTAALRQTRAHTLALVFSSTARVFVLILAGFMVLNVLGINLAPLLAGASLVGLAVTLSTQSLLKDLVNGFMILLEGRYDVGESVRIGAFSGRVEEVNLRLTFLRDLDGALHILPNGTIDTITNLSRNWRRITAEVILPTAQTGRALEALEKLCAELPRDPAFQNKLLEPPRVSEIEATPAGTVRLRVAATTRPADFAALEFELQKRLFARFAQEGIESATVSAPAAPRAL